MKTSPCLVVAGNYGFGNLGDEGILVAMLDRLRAALPEPRFTVVSGDPEKTAALHGVEAASLTDPTGVAAAVAAADLVLIGGGGLFQDYWGFDPEAVLSREQWGIGCYASPAVWAALLGKRALLYAVGVGPLFSEHSRRFVRAVAGSTVGVTVRDEPSRAELLACGVESGRIAVSADPAFLLQPAPADRLQPLLTSLGREAGVPFYGVALRYWDRGVLPSFAERQIAEALDRFLDRRPGRIGFLPFHSDEEYPYSTDLAVANRVHQAMRNGERARVLASPVTPAELAGLLGACDLVVGMRLHSLIFSSLGGVPCVALPYDAKVRSHAERLGVGDLALDVADVDAGELCKRMETLLNERESRGETVRTAAASLALEAAGDVARAAALAMEEGDLPRDLPAGLTAVMTTALQRHLKAGSTIPAAPEASAPAELAERLAIAEHEVARLRALGGDLARQVEALLRYQKDLKVEIGRLDSILTRIYKSRFWKGTNLYWRGRRLALRLLGKNRGAAAPAGGEPGGEALLPGEAILRERLQQTRGVVVFLPSIGWKVDLFQRPHHLARAFTERGYTAVFDCSNAIDEVDGYREIEPNLFLFRGATENLYRLPDPIVWAFTYNYHQSFGFSPGSHLVYDWIDDLAVFPHDLTLLANNHRRGLSEATLVASVARRLDEEARAVRPDALYLPNAVEYERFAGPSPEGIDDPALAELLAAGRPIAGYYGALADWFDYEMLAEVAVLRPDWSFLLIGPDYDRSLGKSPLLKQANVRWLGPRPYPTLPGYLQHFAVATIPFRINDITRATSPLKLYEYFAGGKPVITTPMPECQAFPEIRIVQNAAEFAGALDGARESGEDPRFRARLRELGEENSWRARVGEVLARLGRQ